MTFLRVGKTFWPEWIIEPTVSLACLFGEYLGVLSKRNAFKDSLSSLSSLWAVSFPQKSVGKNAKQVSMRSWLWVGMPQGASSNSHWEISISSLSSSAIMLQHVIIHFFLKYYLLCKLLWEVKNKSDKENFKVLAQQMVVVAYKRWLLTIGSIIWLENFWYFGKLFAEERGSLTRGGRKQKLDCIQKRGEGVIEATYVKNHSSLFLLLFQCPHR